jgi:hypothetical protein
MSVEKELIRLSARFRLTKDEIYREQYIALHRQWAEGRRTPAGESPVGPPAHDLHYFSGAKHHALAVKEAEL